MVLNNTHMNGRISTGVTRQNQASKPIVVAAHLSHLDVVTRPEACGVDGPHHTVMALGLGIHLHEVNAAPLTINHAGGF